MPDKKLMRKLTAADEATLTAHGIKYPWSVFDTLRLTKEIETLKRDRGTRTDDRKTPGPARWLMVLCVLGASIATMWMASSRVEYEIALLAWCAGAGGCHLVNYAKWTARRPKKDSDDN